MCLWRLPHLARADTQHEAAQLERRACSCGLQLAEADVGLVLCLVQGERSGTAADDAATAAYTSEEAGGGKALSAAKVRRKKGEALVHQVQQVVKHCLVTEEETRFLRNVFNFIDKDGDGSLDRDEILQILDFLGERKSALKDKEAVDHFMARLKLDRVTPCTRPLLTAPLTAPRRPSAKGFTALTRAACATRMRHSRLRCAERCRPQI